MTPLRAVPATALALLLLAGCTGPRIVRSDLNALYSSGEFFAAADGRDLRTIIQGNPYGSTPGFEQLVAQIMTGTYVGPRTRFTPTPGPTENRDYFVSVVFNAQPAVNPFDLCDRKTWTTAPAMRPILVRAAFCVAGREASAVTGFLDQSSGPDDPAFINLISHLTIELFPYTPPPLFGRFGGFPD
ncbi:MULTISPECIES: hypothetical protein [unclassified Inquilinus]|uniref:hypothetical protein n=1 Tax=unclassified Inquilinus TaxID=2645927 RepID=UPI003F8E45CC